MPRRKTPTGSHVGVGAGDVADDQTESVLGVFLQRARRAAGGDGIHQPDYLCSGDGLFRFDCDRQRVAFAAVESTDSNQARWLTSNRDCPFTTSLRKRTNKILRHNWRWKVSVNDCDFQPTTGREGIVANYFEPAAACKLTTRKPFTRNIGLLLVSVVTNSSASSAMAAARLNASPADRP